jgi:hypothetical protein
VAATVRVRAESTRVNAEIRYCREITAELAARAEPELERLFQWWNEQWHETVRARRRVPIRTLRWLGLGLSLLGVGIAGAAIVLTPAACRRSSSAFYEAVIPVFVLFATVFGFMDGIAQALRRWAERRASRHARSVAAKTRRAAPYSVEYVIRDGVLESRAKKLNVSRAIDLRGVESAVLAEDLACLFGAHRILPVKRLVWLPEGGERERLREALQAVGVKVVDVAPGAASAPAILGRTPRDAQPRA